METNEQVLWEEVQQGNKDAFRLLVHPLIPKAYRTAYTVLRSKQLAEETVQNALIELYATIMKGREIHHVSGWFSRLVALRALDTIRKEHDYRTNIDIEGMEIEDAGATTPLDDVLRKEQTDQLLAAIMKLEVNQRLVIGLYYFQELKVEEIAQLLDVKPGTVKSRLYHARIKLCGMLHHERLQTKGMMI